MTPTPTPTPPTMKAAVEMFPVVFAAEISLLAAGGHSFPSHCFLADLVSPMDRMPVIDPAMMPAPPTPKPTNITVRQGEAWSADVGASTGGGRAGSGCGET